ncbi:MAG: M3 family oligoendopeptidase [Chloroflexi bacterium]|nr:M3 family oligoendopeptidase [Chloroflexota bacterium]
MFEGLPETYEHCRDWTWDEFEPLAQALVAVDLSADNVESWLDGWTQITRLYYEIGSRAFVATTVDTSDEAAVERYRIFNDHIQPEYSRVQNQLNRKLVESGLQPAGMEIALRKMRGGIELFREENLPLLSAEQNLATEYNRVIGAQTVEWEGEQVTLRQLQPILSEPDRDRRERAWRLSSQRSLEDRDQLNDIWARSLDLRSQIAANADMPDYRAYRWKALNRFDYTPADALSFVDAIEEVVTPAYARSMERRRRALAVDRLRPWDTQNDPQGRSPLRPFNDVADLQDKTIAIFRALDAELAGYLTLMRDDGCLDLDNRPNKAPGGYCSYFPLSRRPFLFMNAVGLHADVQIMLHEAGHAFHSFSDDYLPWAQQRDAPLEFAEVASMAIELLAAPYLSAANGGFYSRADAARARIEHLEDSLRFWCLVAIVVGFQHWVYTHHDQARDPEKCDDQWESLWDRHMPVIDYSGFENYKRFRWRERMHIFSLPFFFIEYGLAQLGAVQVWANSLNDHETALRQYRQALRLGTTVSLPQVYRAAGAKFAFDADTLRGAVSLIETTIAELEAVERATSS